MSGSRCKIRFSPGHEIRGRWDGNLYIIERELGSGGTASVFLVRNAEDGRVLAMKISRELSGITGEHRTLLFLNQQSEIKNLGILPQVYELDDYCEEGNTYHYIIMEYRNGEALQNIKGRLSAKEIGAVGMMLAIFLHYLHGAGYVFGDLKPGNILYDFVTRKLTVVDFGSVCPKGRNIQQYTPLYDRQNWQAGSRRGDEKYDLFALSMLLLSLHSGVNKALKCRNLTQLLAALTSSSAGNCLLPVIIRGLRQEYSLSGEMAVELWRSRNNSSQGSPARRRTLDRAVNVAGAVSAVFFILSILFYYQ